jgi:hypothetical protein
MINIMKDWLGRLTMLLGSKMRPAVALLTLIFHVTAEATEAYSAIPLSNAEAGKIMACFRKRKK